MRKIAIGFVLTLMLLCLSGCTSNDNKDSESQPVEIETATSQSLPEYISDGIKTEDFLKAYGLSMDEVRWYDKPSTDEEFYSSFFYAFFTGDYQFNRRNTELVGGCKHVNSKKMQAIYDSFFGIFLNINCELYYMQDGFHIVVNGDAPINQEEICNTLFEAYKAAKQIYDDVHSKGIVVEGMTQLEIADAYADYLVLNVPYVSKPDWLLEFQDRDATKEPMIGMLCDGAYNMLVNHWGDCGAHAHAFSLFMNMEDILCETVWCNVGNYWENNGHVCSILYIDGNEYICDLIRCTLGDSDYCRILPIEDYKNWNGGCTFDEEWLYLDRVAFGTKEAPQIDDWRDSLRVSWEYVGTDKGPDGDILYKITLLNPEIYHGSDEDVMDIRCQSPSFFCCGDCYFKQLKEGFVFHVPHYMQINMDNASEEILGFLIERKR